jgi:pantoate kinase
LSCVSVESGTGLGDVIAVATLGRLLHRCGAVIIGPSSTCSKNAST